MATTQAAQDDRTSEIAIFARLIKANDGDLSRELARYMLTHRSLMAHELFETQSSGDSRQ
jgi:hypothetical protein